MILTTPALLAFAGMPPTEVPCFPLSQQVAEKVHAYTQPHPAGQSSRVKDLIDILLIAEFGPMDARVLRQALEMTFHGRNTHRLPLRLPEPPSTWSASFGRLADDVGPEYQVLDDASAAARRFLDPVLDGEVVGTWDSVACPW